VLKGRLLAVDVAIATFLFLWALAEVYGSGAENQVGPRWATFTAYGLAAALVAGRRWRPLLVLSTQCFVLSVPVLVWGASEALASLLPVLVVMYTLAAQAPRRQVLLGGAALGANVLLSVLWDPLLDAPTDVVGAAPFVILVAVAWAMGEYTRTRRLYVAGLAAQVRARDREQAITSRLAVLSERQRIAQELHDVIAHGLTVMIRQVEAGLIRLDSDPPRARASLDAVAVTGREALGELRVLVSLLNSSSDARGAVADSPANDSADQAVGLSSLPGLAARMSAAGLHVRVTDERSSASIPSGIDLTAYRIVQEALTNVLRHAHASSATVLVRRSADQLSVDVEDDGRGLEPGSPDGHGLQGMRERAGVYGGTVHLRPAEPHGCRVSTRIPLTRPAPTPR
jgi:signal transduction histidine kinase